MHFVCWITKPTDTHTQNMKYLLLFHGNNGYANAPNVTLSVFYFNVFISLARSNAVSDAGYL